MSTAALNKALWSVYRFEESVESMRADADGFCSAFDLTPDEAAWLSGRDMASLLKAGCHPFLMYAFALALNGGFSYEFITDYIAQLEGLELHPIET